MENFCCSLFVEVVRTESCLQKYIRETAVCSANAGGLKDGTVVTPKKHPLHENTTLDL
jgi:hypothetical protein